MPETVQIVDYNPAVFFQELEDNVNKGFYADHSVVGHPTLDSVNAIILTEGEQPAQLKDYSEQDEVFVEEYDNTALVLGVQDAILQGFTVDLYQINLQYPGAGAFTFGPHSVRLTRKVAPTFALAPVKADPVPEPTQEAENVPQEPTEAPKPRNKGGRPPKKPKEE